MSRSSPFKNNVEQYEQWFTKYSWVYEAELRAVKSLLPNKGRGVEIGVGTGRFASSLGITIGVDPTLQMAKRAQERGIKVFGGVAEKLPFANSVFDFLIMITTVCFVDNVHKAFQEAHRVLSRQGHLIVAFVDRESPLGKTYEEHKKESVFYKNATFFAAAELSEIIQKSGFGDLDFRQTVFQELPKVSANEPLKEGYGDGSFVVVRCAKK